MELWLFALLCLGACDGFPPLPSPALSTPSDAPGPVRDPDAIRKWELLHQKPRQKIHGLRALRWSSFLAEKGYRAALKICRNKVFDHDSETLHRDWEGENLSLDLHAFDHDKLMERAMKGFVDDELPCYHWETNHCDKHPCKCGHYKQVVWDETTEFGCGMATCEGWPSFRKPYTITSCHYTPPGNVNGRRPYGRAPGPWSGKPPKPLPKDLKLYGDKKTASSAPAASALTWLLILALV